MSIGKGLYVFVFALEGFNNGGVPPASSVFVSDTAFTSVFGAAEGAASQPAGIWLKSI